MQIRQLALHYRPEADRLLLRVNAADGQFFAVWFTRRLTVRLWPHLDQMVTAQGVRQELHQQAAGDATPVPEAQAMLASAARERALTRTDFSTPFDSGNAKKSEPLGPEPMLATEVQLAPLAQGALRLLIVDDKKRTLQLQLTEEMATAVRELMTRALAQADWGIAPQADASVAPAEAVDKRRLN